MVRNPQGKHADELLKKKVVGIGWPEAVPFLKAAKDPEDFYDAIRKAYPGSKGQEVVNAGRQLYKFFHEMKDGDTVVTYDSPKRTYHVGTIAGGVQSDPDVEAPFSNVRAVKWQQRIERDGLSQAARNSLGSTLTIFEPSEEAEAEIRKRIDEPNIVVQPEATPTAEVETEDPFANAVENSKELIKDRLIRLSWEDMQSLVAGILRAMGYKTKISIGGGDRGKDVVASPDGLGLEQPRIFVEVKHRRGQMGAPEIRQFIGGRHAQNDRCVFVSTGGFSTEAKYEAERSSVPLTLVDSDDLVALLIDYYETTDAEIRRDARRRRALERLGAENPKCVICGESDPLALELHHLEGQAYGNTLVIVCRNCHRKLSDRQKDHPEKIADPPDTLESNAHLQLGLADFFEFLTKRLRKSAAELLGEADPNKDNVEPGS